MRNRYPGTCGCGKGVAKGKGTLQLVEDIWTVWCSNCQQGTQAAPEKSINRRRRAKKSGNATTRSTVRKRSTAYGKRSNRRSGRKNKAAQVNTTFELPATDWNLMYMPLAYDAYIETANGRIACTSDYAKIDSNLKAASKARDKAKELELLVLLSELRQLSHLAEDETVANIDTHHADLKTGKMRVRSDLMLAA